LLWRRPALAIVAGLSMAAGISLTATVFSLLDAAVLRPLPVSDPDRLTVVLSRRNGGVNHNFSYPDFDRLSIRPARIHRLGRIGSRDCHGAHRGGVAVVEAELVSGSLLRDARYPRSGRRLLNEGDLEASANPVAVVAESLWRELAGWAAPFDGRTAVINGQSFAIVGVVERRFHGIQMGRDVRIWATINLRPIVSPSSQPDWNRRTLSWLTIWLA
jgi:hypothetical protein